MPRRRAAPLATCCLGTGCSVLSCARLVARTTRPGLCTQARTTRPNARRKLAKGGGISVSPRRAAHSFSMASCDCTLLCKSFAAGESGVNPHAVESARAGKSAHPARSRASSQSSCCVRQNQAAHSTVYIGFGAAGRRRPARRAHATTYGAVAGPADSAAPSSVAIRAGPERRARCTPTSQWCVHGN